MKLSLTITLLVPTAFISLISCSEQSTAPELDYSKAVLSAAKLLDHQGIYTANGKTAQFKDSLNIPNTSLMSQPQGTDSIKLSLSKLSDSTGMAHLYLNQEEICLGNWSILGEKIKLSLSPIAGTKNTKYCTGNTGPFTIKLSEHYMAIDALALGSDPGWVFFERPAN